MNYAELYKNEPDYIKDKKVDADWAVWKEGNILNVRFEGSKSFLDWVMDLWFCRSKVAAYDGATWKAHKGFKTAYYSVRSKVLDKCYELYEEGDKIRVLGHSLGGGMGLISVEDIGWHFKQKITLITWGAPRPVVDDEGMKAISEYLAEDSVCFENGSDPVPGLPWFYKLNPNTKHLGKKFNFFKAFAVKKYHCGYGDEILYV